ARRGRGADGAARIEVTVAGDDHLPVGDPVGLLGRRARLGRRAVGRPAERAAEGEGRQRLLVGALRASLQRASEAHRGPLRLPRRPTPPPPPRARAPTSPLPAPRGATPAPPPATPSPASSASRWPPPRTGRCSRSAEKRSAATACGSSTRRATSSTTHTSPPS